MEQSTVHFADLAAASKRFAGRLITTGENRLELLMVELQEERERLLHAIVLALCAAVLGLLGVMTLSAAIVILLWPFAPVLVLAVLTALFAGVAIYLYRRLKVLLREWKSFPATLDQLGKDRACLERNLA
jgi:uncharacterized membrane protein YqjE